MLWRRGLTDDFSDLPEAAVAAVAAAAPGPFSGPLDVPAVACCVTVDDAAPPSADSAGPPATESTCPTAAMALSLSLGRVLVEPME